jgi:hypothetical protein
MNTSGNEQVHHPFSKKVVRAAEKIQTYKAM